MGVVTPVTVSAPAATRVDDAMVVLANFALVARSVHDCKVPGVAAERVGRSGSSLLAQAARAKAAPSSSKPVRGRGRMDRRMRVSMGVC